MLTVLLKVLFIIFYIIPLTVTLVTLIIYYIRNKLEIPCRLDVFLIFCPIVNILVSINAYQEIKDKKK